MSTSIAESRVQGQRKELERQRKKQADEEKKAADADSKALKAESKVRPGTSDTSRQMMLREAERYRDAAAKARDAAARASSAVAQAQGKVHEAEQQLADARARDEKRLLDRRRQKEREAERERERADTERKRQQRRTEQQQKAADADRERKDRVRDLEIRSLHSQVGSQAEQLRQAPWLNVPEEITVLFIAASPEDQHPLRLDQEVREIQRRVRESEYRDKVRFELRLATRTEDLVQALNEVRPHVVHFSGHGSQEALAFETVDGGTKRLSNDRLAGLLDSTSDRIRLAVFNSCSSAAQAELACGYLDAAIGMDESIEDEASKIFAGQFYNALGFGRSVAQAFKQACIQVDLALGSTSGAPRLHSADGVDPEELVLVAARETRAA